MHLHAELSNLLDITKTEEELLANMRKATRYEIKQAQKLGIRITTSQDSADIGEFYDLQIERRRGTGLCLLVRNFCRSSLKCLRQMTGRFCIPLGWIK